VRTTQWRQVRKGFKGFRALPGSRVHRDRPGCRVSGDCRVSRAREDSKASRAFRVRQAGRDRQDRQAQQARPDGQAPSEQDRRDHRAPSQVQPASRGHGERKDPMARQDRKERRVPKATMETWVQSARQDPRGKSGWMVLRDRIRILPQPPPIGPIPSPGQFRRRWIEWLRRSIRSEEVPSKKQ